jgi:hypothetical protein
MKKFVFISLILALAASVAFAQDEGSWSVGGSGEIGTLWNFRSRNDLDNGPGNHIKPTVSASGYNMYGYYGDRPTGTLSAKYSKGSLSAGLGFDITDSILASVSYDDGTAAFSAEIPLRDLVDNDYTKTGRLWGYYKFLDGKIHLEVAVNSRDTNYWISNEAVGNLFDSSATARYDLGWGFASVDHHNYLAVNFAPIDGLEVGFILPGIFTTNIDIDGGKWNWIQGAISGMTGWGVINGDGTPPGHHNVLADHSANYGFLSKSLSNLRFGAKYATGPVEVAAQFALMDVADKYNALNSGLYLGGKYNISDGISAGLAMEAKFDGRSNDVQTKKDGEDKTKFGFAASFNYGAGALNAGLEGGLVFENSFKNKYAKKGMGKDKGIFGLKPQVAYNIVENYLCLSLESYLFFDLDSDVSKAKGIGYQITPELWFNVAGTGAGKGYYYPNGGPAIIVRYMVGGYTKDAEDPATDPNYNALDITFKWAF